MGWVALYPNFLNFCHEMNFYYTINLDKLAKSRNLNYRHQ
jgi:hypothetical protein